MIFKFLTTKFSRETVFADSGEGAEVLHPTLAYLVAARAKDNDRAAHERDYGATRRTVRMPDVFA
jgi:hypothetical protein